MKTAATAAILLVVYFLAGKLGLSLAFVNSSASAVWPASGIALASILILGYRFWPIIFVGAFLVNLTTTGYLPTSLGIAIGNTLEAVVGAYLVNRFANGRQALEQTKSFFLFILLAGMLSTAISATIGVTSLSLGGLAKWSAFYEVWITWWLGDCVGDFVVAPLLILWGLKSPIEWNRVRYLEIILLFSTLLLMGNAMFGPLLPPQIRGYIYPYLFLPLLIWPVFRFGPREVSWTTVAISTLATWGTLNGYGPFVKEDKNVSLLLLQFFMGVITISVLPLSAIVLEQKRAQALLKKSYEATEEKLNLVIRSIQDYAICMLDPEGKISGWNRGAGKIFGYHTEEILNRHFSQFYPQEDIEWGKPDYELSTALREGRFEESGWRIDKNGNRFWANVIINPIRDEKGELLGYAKITRDLTEKKQVEEALQRSHEELERRVEERTRDLLKANEELRRLNQIKTDFTAMVSHELRTPLTSIQEGIGLLIEGKGGPLSSDQRENLEIVRRNVSRLSRLIDEVLDFQRLEAGRMKYEMKPHSINTLVLEAIHGFLGLAEKKGLQIKSELAPRIPPAHCDKDKILQVLVNLLDNSIKFAERGSITVKTAQNGGRALVSIEDQGIGIRPEDQVKLFKSFSQVSSPTGQGRKTGGSGLGLVISKKIVEDHGGKIGLKSTYGEGSTFYFELPLVS